MYTEPKLVDPAWAQAQLKALEEAMDKGLYRQRPARERAVQRYAQDMKAGKWLLTHQGIAFDVNSHLLDGQNRLWAVIRSGASVWMNVTYNVPVGDKLGENPMDVVDQGVPRNLANALLISHGYERANEAAKLTRGIIGMVIQVSDLPKSRNNKDISVAVSTAEALFVLEELGYQNSLERLVTIITPSRARRGPLIASLAWYHGVKPKKAEELARQYTTLEELPKGSPALAMYRYFEDTTSKRKRYRVEQTLASANAVYLWDRDEKCNLLVPSREALRWLVQQNAKHADAILKRVTR